MGVVTMPRSRSYQEDLLTALKEPEEAQEYLKAALEDVNPEVFLLALKDVIEANQNRGRSFAQGKDEDEIFSFEKSSELTNLQKVLSRLGYRLTIEKLSA
jgi:tetratricopeptide (TPR) repeat protein